MSNFDPTALLNYGVLGAVILLAVLGYVWFRPSVDRLIEERDRLVAERDKAIEQRDQMAQIFQEKLLPITNDFISATRTLLPILQQLIHQSGEPYAPQPPPRPGKGRDQGRRRGEQERGRGRGDHDPGQ